MQNKPSDIIGTIVTLVGGVAAWQEQLEWSLRIIAALIGIVTGIVVLYRMLRKPKKV